MKNGLDQHDYERSNVVSFTSAQKRPAKSATRSAGGDTGRTTAGQWLMSALFVALGVGGVVALVVPLLRAIGILGG